MKTTQKLKTSGASSKTRGSHGNMCTKAGPSFAKAMKHRLGATGQPLCPLGQAVETGSADLLTSLPTSEALQLEKPLPKLKLQLFPIDEDTCRMLEKDQHNPYLELTITLRKKISSVVKHLSNKWDKSKTRPGELVLYPFETRLENLSVQRRWTLKDANTYASDVYESIGSPAVFRLRYGWLSNTKRSSSDVPATLYSKDNSQCHGSQSAETNNDKRWLCPVTSQEHGPASIDQTLNPGTCIPLPLQRSIEIVDNLRMGNHASTLSWDDGLTNVSFGELLSRSFPLPDAKESNPFSGEKNVPLQPVSFSCDSFDAAIAAFILCQRGSDPSTRASQSSILDAEETCHGFPLQKCNFVKHGDPLSSRDDPTSVTQNFGSIGFPNLAEVSEFHGHAFQGPTTDPRPHTQNQLSQEPPEEFLVQPQDAENVAGSLGLSNIVRTHHNPMGILQIKKSVDRDV